MDSTESGTSMAALPYMQLYVADYLADTSHLNAAQHGAYMLLLMNYWQRGKALPDVNERLATVARMTNDEWAANRDVLAELFEITPEGWFHTRVERDLQKVKGISNAGKIAGIASGIARKQRALNDRSTTVPTESQRIANHTDTDTDTEADTKTKSAAKAATDPRFTPFKEKIKAYVEYMKEPFVWDGSESKALSLLLKATPDLTADDFSLFLRNRAKSEVALGDRPRKWIPSITSYTVPLDRFGKPQESRRAFGRPDPSVGGHRSQEGGKESQGGALSVDQWRWFRDKGSANYKYCPPNIRKIIESEDAK